MRTAAPAALPRSSVLGTAAAFPVSYGWLAALLILAAAGMRVAYLASDQALDLAPDEAHYWDWSRHLDWSYYSKGPAVAYLIRASCAVFGTWSTTLTGSEVLAVRLPAVLCGSLLLVSLYVFTVQVYGRERLAVAVVALALTLPPVAVGASLMTIDAPFLCCWGWALVTGHRAVFRDSSWAWPLTGLLVGLGVLAKYTMLLWLPAFGLFLLTTPAHRRLLCGRGFWSMVAVAAVCCLPVLVWNVQHDWLGLRHVGGQAGVRQGTTVRWLGPVSFLAVQAALLLGFWFAAWLAAMGANRPWRRPCSDSRTAYLWWMSAVVFGVFLAFSGVTAEEPNWPVASYLSGLVLAAAWLDARLRSGWRWPLVGAATTCVLGLALTAALHVSTCLHPLLAPLAGPPTAEQPLPLRRLDPTCRLRGWRTLAEAVDGVRAELRAKGVEPVLVAANWTYPGELAFYCSGHPVVYSFGPALGDRHSQYDLWRPNPLYEPEAFLGRTVVFVGEPTPAIRAAFERVMPCQVVTHEVNGHPVARWTVTVCRGFRGFPADRINPLRY